MADRLGELAANAATMAREMIPTTRRPVPQQFSEHLLITRIITSLGLCLLLVVGLWSAAHSDSSETGETAVVATLATFDMDPNWVAAEGPPVADIEAVATLPDAAFAAVACLLGILCCLVVMAMLRLTTVRSSASFLLRAGPRPCFSVTATGRPITPSLTLTQLSLSRT